jgi:hypothetical protein
MISDGQAKALLEECEAAAGRPLHRLRSQLASSHDTLGALWELVTTNVATGLGPGVEHEPNDGTPDVLVDLPGIDRFWIEATHIGSPEREASKTISNFIDWIRLELKRRHGIEPNLYDIRCDPLTVHANAVIPDEHTWAGLRRSQEWLAFAEKVRERPKTAVATVLSGGFSAKVTVTFHSQPHKYLTAGYRSPNVVKTVRDHPVWSALRSKASQARAWKLEDPIVVCIGSSLSVSLFDSPQNFAPGPEAAVAGALYDTSKWHMGAQHNVLRDTSGADYRVKGADRISAVILVSIEDKKTLDWYRHDHHRIARTKFVINQQARYPLSEAQLRALATLNFNKFPYGPQWETWPEPSRREWKSRERIMKRSEPGKVITYVPRPDGSLDLYIPTEALTKLLAGVEGIEGLLESIRGVYADKQLSALPPLERAEVVPGDPKQRKGATVKLTFGVPRPPVIQAMRQVTGTGQQKPETDTPLAEQSDVRPEPGGESAER